MLFGMADAGFVWLSGGWLVGFQLSSGAGMFPLCDCFFFCQWVDPLCESRGRDNSAAYIVRKEAIITFPL